MAMQQTDVPTRLQIPDKAELAIAPVAAEQSVSLDESSPAESAPSGNMSQTTPAATPQAASPPREVGGRDGLDPTRFGDWEKAGRCIDF